MTTHEPEQPLPGWPESHVHVLLTGINDLECIRVRIHGEEHYLHSTTARSLEQQLTSALINYHKQVKRANRAHGTRIPEV